MTALLLAASIACATACEEAESKLSPRDIEAEVSSDIATVVRVRWTTEEPSVGYVEYGAGSELDRRTPVEDEPTREHEVTLLGLKSDTEYEYRVVTQTDDGREHGDVESIRTGDLPTGVPRLTVEGDGHEGFTLVPILGMTTAVTILDEDGDVVWYRTDDRELDFYRVRFSIDGESLLYNAASVSGDPADDSELVRVALDGSRSSSIAVPLLAHDFVEHADGTIGALVVEYRDFEGTELRGDKVVEIDGDGEITTIWSAWDCFDPAEVTGDDIDHGWTFANALDYDPDEDAYYVGMRNFSSITKVDRDSGECEWVLGLYGSTFDFASGSKRFLHKHQFEIRGDHMLVMDNEGATGQDSRVIEYELDFEQSVATEIWTYEADPPVYTFVLGEPMRLENGDTFISWSAAGQLERVNPDGESIWKLNTRAGTAFGYHTLEDSLYPARARTE